MSKILVRGVLVFAAAWFWLIPPLAAAAGNQLVDVAWLKENLQRDDLLLIDASPGGRHVAGHIPGAVNVDIFAFGGREVTTEVMERRIQSWGVSSGKQIVLYDQGGTHLATSLFFDLYYHGFPREGLKVLDGGMAKWQASGGAVTKEATPKPKPGSFRIVTRQEEVRARLPEFLAATGDPARSKVVEALDSRQHFGADKFFDRAGHVPNAIMAPVDDFYNADKTFKSPEEIARMMDYLGVTRDRAVYSHCGGGIAASVPFFAMKFVLDYPDVKLYKESQLEWLRDDRGLPFWTYDAPQLLREKAWVAGWNAQMLRMFGVSRLNVVDIRPAAAFGEGHVPFAINIPAETFRRQMANPAALAETLGAAGVVMADETVIVSNGLTPDSALAFLMFEQLGQKKVSVLADSVEDWAFAGLEITRESKPLPPRKYPPALRAGLVTRDPSLTQGLYPKVYVASGKSLPTKLPEGRVIHVPYSDLVNANGSPKAARDIWDALVKAGVPRYAEIVTFSDDPGEAAANYFVLKLMGYPDVKVFVIPA
ncbi:MAG: rhodanese-like domain-containing protein [Usitatibacter sp.]